jgi:cytochrome c oxidase subunit 2
LRSSLSRTRLFRRAAALALLALAILAVPAGADGIAPVDAHSPNADDIRTTYWVMLAITTLLGLAALGGLGAAVSRFREGKSPQARRITAGRGAVRKVTLPLAVLALAIFIFGIAMTESAQKVEPAGPDGLTGEATAQVGVSDVPTGDQAPVHVNVIGQQWLWRFEYPDVSERDDISTVFSYGELVVPVDTPVVLDITSTDVLHRWFVPALGGQVEAVPDEHSQTWFKADAEGVYKGVSTMFSGSNYPAMRATVRVVGADEYNTYLEDLAGDIQTAQTAVQQAGADTAQQGASAQEEGTP